MNTTLWKPLIDLAQLDEIVSASKEKTIGIFKHSTRCAISRMVLKDFEQSLSEHTHIEYYFLDLLNYRDISNEIAQRFDVVHQSPQFILIHNGAVAHHSSHNQILNVNLNNY